MTVLIVDDEPDLGELIAFEFELVGAKVINARNGKEAYELIKRTEVDVVVSDIRMPGGDGVELLEHIRRDHPASPALIFMTGFADISLEEAYDRGAVAIFGKPFNRRELIACVARCVLPYSLRWADPGKPASTFYSLEATFPTAKEAQKATQFAVGRGGFFCAKAENLPTVGEIVLFQLNFTSGPMPVLHGEGIARWTRRQNENSLPAGMGIEINHLSGDKTKEAIDFFVAQHPSAFIPRT